MIMTPLIFFLPHSSKTGPTNTFLITITARSIGFGTSSTLLYAFLEKTLSRVGLIGYTVPLKPFIILDVIVAPTLPFLSEAPITAIDFGDRMADSDMICWIQVFV